MDECPNQKGPVDNNGVLSAIKMAMVSMIKTTSPLQAEDLMKTVTKILSDVDTNKDGLEDDVDQCPTQPEDIDGFVDEDTSGYR